MLFINPQPLKNRILALCLGAGAIALALSNPDEASHRKYVLQQLSQSAERSCQVLEQDVAIAYVVSIASEDICHSLFELGKTLVNPLAGFAIDRVSDRKNLGLLSIHTLSLGDEKRRSIGIAGQFVPLPRLSD